MSTLIRFSTSADIGSLLVCARTKSIAAHVDFILPNGLLLGSVPGRGVCVRPTNRVLWSRVVKLDVNQGWHWALTQVGKRYDWRAIAGLSVGLNWSDASKWYCSELVLASLLAAGWDGSGLTMVAPGGLLQESSRRGRTTRQH